MNRWYYLFFFYFMFLNSFKKFISCQVEKDNLINNSNDEKLSSFFQPSSKEDNKISLVSLPHDIHHQIYSSLSTMEELKMYLTYPKSMAYPVSFQLSLKSVDLIYKSLYGSRLTLSSSSTFNSYSSLPEWKKKRFIHTILMFFKHADNWEIKSIDPTLMKEIGLQAKESKMDFGKINLLKLNDDSIEQMEFLLDHFQIDFSLLHTLQIGKMKSVSFLKEKQRESDEDILKLKSIQIKAKAMALNFQNVQTVILNNEQWNSFGLFFMYFIFHFHSPQITFLSIKNNFFYELNQLFIYIPNGFKSIQMLCEIFTKDLIHLDTLLLIDIKSSNQSNGQTGKYLHAIIYGNHKLKRFNLISPPLDYQNDIHLLFYALKEMKEIHELHLISVLPCKYSHHILINDHIHFNGFNSIPNGYYFMYVMWLSIARNHKQLDHLTIKGCSFDETSRWIHWLWLNPVNENRLFQAMDEIQNIQHLHLQGMIFPSHLMIKGITHLFNANTKSLEKLLLYSIPMEFNHEYSISFFHSLKKLKHLKSFHWNFQPMDNSLLIQMIQSLPKKSLKHIDLYGNELDHFMSFSDIKQLIKIIHEFPEKPSISFDMACVQKFCHLLKKSEILIYIPSMDGEDQMIKDITCSSTIMKTMSYLLLDVFLISMVILYKLSKANI